MVNEPGRAAGCTTHPELSVALQPSPALGRLASQILANDSGLLQERSPDRGRDFNRDESVGGEQDIS